MQSCIHSPCINFRVECAKLKVNGKKPVDLSPENAPQSICIDKMNEPHIIEIDVQVRI